MARGGDETRPVPPGVDRRGEGGRDLDLAPVAGTSVHVAELQRAREPSWPRVPPGFSWLRDRARQEEPPEGESPHR